MQKIAESIVQLLLNLPRWCYGKRDTRGELLLTPFGCFVLIVFSTVVYVIVTYYMYVVFALMFLAMIGLLASELVDDLRRLKASRIWPKQPSPPGLLDPNFNRWFIGR